tara:strand:- start:11930 stop:12298 length:369 start_codon:yes stop_codon:yes gene_type:complete
MADRNYLKQPQGDADAAEALKHTTVVDVTIGGGLRVGPYYPGNAKSVLIATTGNVKFQIRGSGNTNGLAATEFRDVVLTSEATTAVVSGNKVGHLDTGAVPHEFYLLDTSGSSNPVTMYINY